MTSQTNGVYSAGPCIVCGEFWVTAQCNRETLICTECWADNLIYTANAFDSIVRSLVTSQQTPLAPTSTQPLPNLAVTSPDVTMDIDQTTSEETSRISPLTTVDSTDFRGTPNSWQHLPSVPDVHFPPVPSVMNLAVTMDLSLSISPFQQALQNLPMTGVCTTDIGPTPVPCHPVPAVQFPQVPSQPQSSTLVSQAGVSKGEKSVFNMPPAGAGKRKLGDCSWSGDSGPDGQRPSLHRPDSLDLAQQGITHPAAPLAPQASSPPNLDYFAFPQPGPAALSHIPPRPFNFSTLPITPCDLSRHHHPLWNRPASPGEPRPDSPTLPVAVSQADNPPTIFQHYYPDRFVPQPFLPPGQLHPHTHPALTYPGGQVIHNPPIQWGPRPEALTLPLAINRANHDRNNFRHVPYTPRRPIPGRRSAAQRWREMERRARGRDDRDWMKWIDWTMCSDYKPYDDYDGDGGEGNGGGRVMRGALR